MKINWPLVLVLLWFSVMVGVIVDQQAFAAIMALATAVVTGCVVLSWVWARFRPKADWRVSESTEKTLIGLTPDDVYPPDVAAMIKAHFSEPHPGVLVMGRNTDGSWEFIKHPKDEPDI